MSLSLKLFVVSFQTALQKFLLIGEALEACGLKCEHELTVDWEFGFEWTFQDRSLYFTINYEDFETIKVNCCLIDEENDTVVVEWAQDQDNQVDFWSFIFAQTVVSCSSLDLLTKKVIGSESEENFNIERVVTEKVIGFESEENFNLERVVLEDEALAFQVIKMMVEIFKGEGN